jgi:hypothetical protein
MQQKNTSEWAAKELGQPTQQAQPQAPQNIEIEGELPEGYAIPANAKRVTVVNGAVKVDF